MRGEEQRPQARTPPLVYATTPYWQEDGRTLERVRRSLPDRGVAGAFGWFMYEGALRHFHLGGRFKTESELRDHGRARAQSAGAKWWLQLDADERLINGERLPALLEAWPRRAYPLPRLEEDGRWQVCPYKLVRLPCALVCGCDHFTWPEETGPVVWLLSGYAPPTESQRDVLLTLPHLVHEPSRREAVKPRLGELEGVLESRPASVPLPMPSLTLEAR